MAPRAAPRDHHRAPPTVSRRIPVAALGRSARNTNLVVDRHGMVVGSASVRVPTLEHVNMHLAPARRVWSRYVNPAFLTPEDPRERSAPARCPRCSSSTTSPPTTTAGTAATSPRTRTATSSSATTTRAGSPTSSTTSARPASSGGSSLPLRGDPARDPEALRASIAQDPEGARGHLIPDQSYTVTRCAARPCSTPSAARSLATATAVLPGPSAAAQPVLTAPPTPDAARRSLSSLVVRDFGAICYRRGDPARRRPR